MIALTWLFSVFCLYVNDMNAIISLCHFCDVHGPSVTTCTQAFHSPEPGNCCESAQQASVADDVTSKEQPNSWDCLRDSWNEDCKSTAASVSAPASPTLCTPEKQRSDNCEVGNLWCQDTSDPRHFGTITLVPKYRNLDHTFLVYVNFYICNITHLLLSSGVCV